MNRNEFEQLFKTALETAALNAELKLDRKISRRFQVHLFGAGHSGDLMTVDATVDNLYLSEDRFYLIIDVAVTEIQKQLTTVFVRASDHSPGTFEQTWDTPSGSGPFKQMIAKEIKIIETDADLKSDVIQPKNTFDSEKYREFIIHYGQIRSKYSQLYQLHLKYEPEKRRDSPEVEQMAQLREQSSQMWQEYLHRVPVQLVAQCPYCASQILQPVDNFSLLGFYPLLNLPDYYNSAEAWVANPSPPRKCCQHAVVATISVNLNNLLPDDLPQWALRRKWGKLDAAPRLMVWPLIARKTSAVIHALPIGRLDDSESIHRYTAYFVTYFASDATNLYTENMWVSTDVGRPATAGVLYDMDLAKWIKAGRLFWLNTDSPNRLVRGPAEACPYTDVQPQGWYEIVENGQINGPNRYYKMWEGEAPLHDQSFSKTIE